MSPQRHIAGLLNLQPAYVCSDAAVVNPSIEYPSFQHCTGKTCFQSALPTDPSRLARWRQRIGEEGVETMLAATAEGRPAASGWPKPVASKSG